MEKHALSKRARDALGLEYRYSRRERHPDEAPPRTFTPRKSMRAFHVWAIRACIFDTPAAGPMILLRLFGWSLHIYPWMHSHTQGGGND